MLGLSAIDAALFVARLVLGLFFVLARFRFFYDPSREECWFNTQRCDSLTRKLAYCGIHACGKQWAWAVAAAEVLAGAALIVGLLTVPAALGLLIVLIFATICTARDKVMEQHPVDKVDVVSCYLWRVEGLYIAFAVIILLAGPGAYSLDYLIWR